MGEVKRIDYNLDGDLRNQDWIKTLSWDVRVGTRLVETYTGLQEAVGSDDKIKHFLTLPAAEPMPDALREELKGRGFDVPEKRTAKQ